MKELDLLKKDWKSKKYPKISADAIYKMLLKKSSSVVKWIFIISLIELGAGVLGGLFYQPEKDLLYYFPKWLSITTTIFALVVPAFFIWKFYQNYKNINTTNSVKELLDTIIKTRKTVKWYVIINVVFFAIVASISIVNALTKPMGIDQKVVLELSTTKEYFMLTLFVFLGTSILVSIALLLYFLMYGILMRKLNHNYKELKKLEM